MSFRQKRTSAVAAAAAATGGRGSHRVLNRTRHVNPAVTSLFRNPSGEPVVTSNTNVHHPILLYALRCMRLRAGRFGLHKHATLDEDRTHTCTYCTSPTTSTADMVLRGLG